MSEIDNTNLQLILLDRDGVINFDSPDFIKSADEWQPIPNAPEAIARLQTTYQVAVCTNQSGLARGYLNESTLGAIHDKLQDAILACGGKAVDIYFCPHGPDDGCSCRKPKPGLLDAAMAAGDISPKATLFAGDSMRDLEAGSAAGCTPVLLLSGNGKKTREKLETSILTGSDAIATFDDLAALADHLLKR